MVTLFGIVVVICLFVCLFLQPELLQWFYETTLEALQDAKNDRLWFKTNTKVIMILYQTNVVTWTRCINDALPCTWWTFALLCMNHFVDFV